MKKILKVLGLIVFILLVALIAVPSIYKKEIGEMVKKEINKELNAQVNFGEIDLSLIRYFPNFSFEINQFSVVGKDTFKLDTLLYIDQLSLKMDLMSVINKEVEVNGIYLSKPRISAIALNDSLVNWNITKASEEPVTEEKTEDSNSESQFKIALKSFKIEEANIKYRDLASDIEAELSGLDFLLSGDFTLSSALLKIKTSIAAINVKMEGINYMKNVQFGYQAGINADMDKMRFELMENNLSLNKINLALNGMVQMNKDESYGMDLSFDTGANQFKDLLSLVPLYYTKDYAGLKTKGEFSVKGLMKGTYSEKRLPQFDFDLKVKDAEVKYPDLPASVNNINVSLNVSNKDGIDDHTLINLKQFDLKVADNPFSAQYISKTPISDPYIEGKIKGEIDFSKLKEAIPLDSMSVEGKAKMNVFMKGHLSTIEQERYEEFETKGQIELNQFLYKSQDLAYDVLVEKGNVQMTPKHIVLEQLDLLIGKSDMHAQGKMSNFLPYYFKGETLKGELQLSSNLIDGSELAGDNSEEATVETTSETPPTANDTLNEVLSVVELPKNIDFILHSKMNKITYGTYIIEQLKGDIQLKEGIAKMKNVSMNMADGLIMLSGAYDSRNVNSPKVDFDMKMKGFDIGTTYKTFTTIQKTAPLAEHCKGDIDVDFAFSSLLNQHMEPVLESINGKGLFKSTDIRLEKSELIDKLYALTQRDDYKTLKLKDINAYFEVKDGLIEFRPIKTKINNIPTTFSGKQVLGAGLDYKINMEIPSASLDKAGAALGGALSKLGGAKLPETIPVDVLIKGTAQKPKISLSMAGIGQGIKEEAKEKVKETVDKAKQEAIAKAEKKAKELMDAANATSEKIMAEARKQAEQIKSEADKQANQLKEETRKEIEALKNKAGNNPFAKKAAELSAKKVQEKADKKIDELNRKAKSKADNLVNEAQKRSDKIKQEAKTKGDQIIEKAKQ